MNRAKWQRMEDVLDEYDIKPLVGIIPANADPKTMIEPEDYLFWNKARNWEKKGWSISLHGYDHVCISDGGMEGLNPFWRRSEFAGLPLDKQREKIRKGYSILKGHGFESKYFFAPSHTFDLNTLEALRVETDIRIISDTIGRYPYKYGDFVFIPQISGHCVRMSLSGIYTFCFHPNTMKENDFVALENFLKQNKEHFIRIDDAELPKYGNKKLLDGIITMLFFFYRRLRRLY